MSLFWWKCAANFQTPNSSPDVQLLAMTQGLLLWGQGCDALAEFWLESCCPAARKSKLKPCESQYAGRSEIVAAVTISWKILGRGERCSTLLKKAEILQTAAWLDKES